MENKVTEEDNIVLQGKRRRDDTQNNVNQPSESPDSKKAAITESSDIAGVDNVLVAKEIAPVQTGFDDDNDDDDDDPTTHCCGKDVTGTKIIPLQSMLIALQLWMFHHGCDLDPEFDFSSNNIVGLLIEQHFFTKECIQNIWTLDNNIKLLAQIVEENESISSISETVVHMLSDAIHSRDQIQRVVDNISPAIDDNFTITQDLRTRILDAQRDIVNLKSMFSDSQSQMLLYLETIPTFYIEKLEPCETAKTIRYINDNIKKFNNISDLAKHFRLKSRSSTSGFQKDLTNSDVASSADVHSPEETNETLKYQVVLQLSVVHKGVSTVKKREVSARCLTCHEKETDYMECYINGTPNNNPVDKYPFLSAVYAFPVNEQLKSTGDSVKNPKTKDVRIGTGLGHSSCPYEQGGICSKCHEKAMNGLNDYINNPRNDSSLLSFFIKNKICIAAEELISQEDYASSASSSSSSSASSSTSYSSLPVAASSSSSTTLPWRQRVNKFIFDNLIEKGFCRVQDVFDEAKPLKMPSMYFDKIEGRSKISVDVFDTFWCNDFNPEVRFMAAGAFIPGNPQHVNRSNGALIYTGPRSGAVLDLIRDLALTEETQGIICGELMKELQEYATLVKTDKVTLCDSEAYEIFF